MEHITAILQNGPMYFKTTTSLAIIASGERHWPPKPKACDAACHMIFLGMGILYIICERSFKEITSQLSLKKRGKKAEIFLMATWIQCRALLKEPFNLLSGQMLLMWCSWEKNLWRGILTESHVIVALKEGETETTLCLPVTHFRIQKRIT